jgi:hypothetical protein
MKSIEYNGDSIEVTHMTWSDVSDFEFAKHNFEGTSFQV